MFLMMVLSAFMKVGAPQPYLLEVELSNTPAGGQYIHISDDGTLEGFDGCHKITGLVSTTEDSYTPTNVKVSEPDGECDAKAVALASNITGVNVTYEVNSTPVGVKISTYPGLTWNLSGNTRLGNTDDK